MWRDRMFMLCSKPEFPLLPLTPAEAGAQHRSAMAFYVYILASRHNGTLYCGSTEFLANRIAEHKDEARPGFTARYGVKTLVWFEIHDTREDAFRRERQIKEWKRAWKLALIEKHNRDWRDLFESIC